MFGNENVKDVYRFDYAFEESLNCNRRDYPVDGFEFNVQL